MSNKDRFRREAELADRLIPLLVCCHRNYGVSKSERRFHAAVAMKRADKMKYPDGADIRLWDRVQIYGGQTGVVVFSIDTDEYSNDFPKKDWAYLASGIMIKTADGTLVHISAPNEQAIARMP